MKSKTFWGKVLGMNVLSTSLLLLLQTFQVRFIFQLTVGRSVFQPVCPSGQRALARVHNQILYIRGKVRSHYRRGTSSLTRGRVRTVSWSWPGVDI